MYRSPVTRTFGVLLAFTCIFALIGATAFAQAPNENAEGADENAQDTNDSASNTVTRSTHNENAQDAGNANPNANQGENPGTDGDPRGRSAQVPPEDPPGDAPGQRRNQGNEGRDGDSQGIANRGSVKISEETDPTQPPADRPHVDCDFRIDFYGFDAGTRAFTLTMHPPTGEGELALGGQVELTQARGNEVSGSSETIRFASLNLHGIERHPQQGWHLMLTVAGADGTLEPPNKTKVFWVDCGLGVGGDDLPAINVTKDVGDAAWQTGSFTFVLFDDAGEALRTGNASPSDRTVGFGELEPGDYLVCEENLPAGWALDSATVGGAVATIDEDGCVAVALDEDDETVAVTFTNQRTVTAPGGLTPGIDVEKLVSVDGGLTWEDADTVTGPQVQIGDDVSFQLEVTNTGETTLTDITLTDSDFSTDACEIPTSLEAGDSFTCVLGPFDAVAGQHSNIATAGADGVSDRDRAHYIGVETVTAGPPIEDVAGEERTAPAGGPVEEDEGARPAVEADDEGAADVDAAQQVPVGGVAAGAGGTAPVSVPVAPVAALLITFGAAAMLRREPVTSQR